VLNPKIPTLNGNLNERGTLKGSKKRQRHGHGLLSNEKGGTIGPGELKKLKEFSTPNGDENRKFILSSKVKGKNSEKKGPWGLRTRKASPGRAPRVKKKIFQIEKSKERPGKHKECKKSELGDPWSLVNRRGVTLTEKRVKGKNPWFLAFERRVYGGGETLSLKGREVGG